VKGSNLTLASFIGASIFIHLLLIWLLNHQSMSNVAITQRSDKDPINATLVIVPLKKTAVIAATMRPELVLDPVPEKVKESASQVVQAPVQKPTPPDDTAPPKAEPAENKSASENVEITPSHSTTDIQPSIKPSAQAILNATKRYTNQINAAAPQIAEPRQATLSSMTGTPTRHHYKVVTQTPEQQRRISITCDSGAKKTLAILSVITGGTIHCDPGPNLADFMPKKRK